MENESIFDNKKSVLIFSMSCLACSHDILQYVMMSYNCLWHCLITSDLSVLIGPKFLSVSFIHILVFRFLISTLSDFFSLLDKFCFSFMSVSKRTLTASLTFQQKLFSAVHSVGGTKLFLRQNLQFFSKTPGFDSDSEKYT